MKVSRENMSKWCQKSKKSRWKLGRKSQTERNNRLRRHGVVGKSSQSSSQLDCRREEAREDISRLGDGADRGLETN